MLVLFALTLVADPGPSRTSTAALRTETLVVTASRRAVQVDDAPVATQVIDRESIERSGARNLAEVLESEPGLRVTPDVTGAIQIQLRGFNTDQVLVLVDGQRIAGRKNGAIDVQRLGVERIERVEIVKGPASALYGADALAGVINIVTRGPKQPLEGSLRLGYGGAPRGLDGQDFSGVTAETFEAAGRVGGRAGAFGWQGTASYRKRGRFDLNPDSPGTTGSDFTDLDGEVAGTFEAGGFKLRLRVDGSTRELEGTDAGALLPGGQRRIDDRAQRITTFGVHVRPELELAGGQLVLDASWSSYDERFVRVQRGGRARAEDELADGIGQAVLQYTRPVFDTHIVLIGLEGLLQTIDATRFPGFQDRQRGAAFIQDEWVPNEAFSVQAGVRVDVDSQFGVFPTPRVAARWRPADPVILRASWGLGFKAPLPRDLGIVFENPGAGYRIEGNPDILPEESSSFSAGVVLIPVGELRLSAEVFHSDVSNLIEPLSGDSTGPGEPLLFTYGNIASASLSGVEAGLEWRPFRQFRLVVGYDFLDARDRTRDRTLPNRAPHRVTAGLGFFVPAWGLDLDLRGAWTDERRFFGGGDEEIVAPAWVRLDARAELAVTEQIGAFLGADNLLDEGDPSLLTIPPRTFFAGLQSRFE